MKIELKYTANKQLNNEMELILEKAIMSGTIFVQNEAIANCPVDTGFLRSSISRKIEDKSGIIYTNVEYAPYVEFGTKKQKAKHFLRNALYTNFTKIKEIISRIIKEGLK